MRESPAFARFGPFNSTQVCGAMVGFSPSAVATNAIAGEFCARIAGETGRTARTNVLLKEPHGLETPSRTGDAELLPTRQTGVLFRSNVTGNETFAAAFWKLLYSRRCELKCRAAHFLDAIHTRPVES